MRSVIHNASINDSLTGCPHFQSLDYEISENELWQNEVIKEENSIVKQDFMRWILFVAIGIVTALVACFVDVLIEIFSDLKYECLQKSNLYSYFHLLNPALSIHSLQRFSFRLLIYSVVDKLTGDKMYQPYLAWLLLNSVPVLIGSIMVTYFEVSIYLQYMLVYHTNAPCDSIIPIIQ